VENLINKGHFFILSSPSGGGKSTIIRLLLEKHEDYYYSVSATTRPPREGEVNGKSYWFLSREEFEAKILTGEFLEYEDVYGDYYGTPKTPAENALSAGKQVIFDLDVKGALRVKSHHMEVVSIFILPPSLYVLEERLRQRGSEREERIQKRLSIAAWECSQANNFDHIVMNDHLEDVVQNIEQIIANTIRGGKP
jgi:guanylate kinase